MQQQEKESVRQYWNHVPCGTGDVTYQEGSLEYFEAIAAKRDRLEPFISDYAEFGKWAGKRVLEVGCGVGSDLLRFAQAGANAVGIDLSSKSALLAKSRLRLYNCPGEVLVADAENLPFAEGEFELIYSWGVLHHTPDTGSAVHEIYRVTKPGGEVRIMLYHRHSLVALQMYVMFGLLSCRPFRNLKDIIARYHESPGTKAYTVSEVRKLFSEFQKVKVEIRLTPYDLRYRRDRYLPAWAGRLVPKCLGWFMVIRGHKPDSANQSHPERHGGI
ncbi:MAG: class I SAM-dependent methyltransferase [Chloroflexota bacterium]